MAYIYYGLGQAQLRHPQDVLKYHKKADLYINIATEPVKTGLKKLFNVSDEAMVRAIVTDILLKHGLINPDPRWK